MIYDAYNSNAVFFLAAAKKSGYTLISASTPSALWDSDATEIILCDIDPKVIGGSILYHPDIGIYLEKNISLIVSIVSYPYISWDRKNVALDYLMSQVYNKKMRQNAEYLASGYWHKNELASRYARALQSAMVKALNTNWTIYEAVYQAVINELASQRTSVLVEEYYELYDQVQEVTNRAISRFQTNSLVRIPKRRVAFAYLDTISDYLDINAIRSFCLKHYPYLSIIQYKLGAKNVTWLLSNKKLNLRQFFQLPLGNTYEAIINAPHKETLQYLRGVVSELKD